MLPGTAACKHDLFLLVGDILAGRLRDLERAASRRLDYETCLGHVDKALHECFMEAAPRDLPEAAGHFATSLRAAATRSAREPAAAILAALADDVEAVAPSWDGAAALARLHRQGRDLARRFAAAAPEAVRARLGITARLALNFDAYGSMAPMSCVRVAADPDDYIITIAFGLDRRRHGLPDASHVHRYLAYPFLFLHEYSAHIHALDGGNERFNDGWLLYAADAFLRQEHFAAPDGLGLHRDQAHIFDDHLRHELRGHPRVGRQLAHDLDAVVGAGVPGWFLALTHELAAFEPGAGETPAFPETMIGELLQVVDEPPRLLGLVRDGPDARELLRRLRG